MTKFHRQIDGSAVVINLLRHLDRILEQTDREHIVDQRRLADSKVVRALHRVGTDEAIEICRLTK